MILTYLLRLCSSPEFSISIPSKVGQELLPCTPTTLTMLYDKDASMGLPALISGAGRSPWHKLHRCFLRAKPLLSMAGKVLCGKAQFEDDTNKARTDKDLQDVSATLPSPDVKDTPAPSPEASQTLGDMRGSPRKQDHFLKIAYLFSHV